MARKRLGEILVQAGVLDETRLRAGLAEQRRWGGPLGRILVDMKLITEDAMVQALSHQLNFPTVNLDQRAVAPEVTELVPADLAEQHSVVPFNLQGKFLDVAMADPTNLGIIDELRIRTRLNVRPYLAGPKSIERAVAKYYGRGVQSLDFNYGSTQGGGPTDLELAAAMPAGARILDAAQVGAADSAAGPPATSIGLGTGMPQFPQQAPRSSPPVPPAAAMMPSIPAIAPLAAGPAAASAATPAAARRAQQFDMVDSGPKEHDRAREVQVLQARVQQLEALVARDEEVLRKLLTLLIDKGIASRDEVLERIK